MKTIRAPYRSARSSADSTALPAVPEPSVPTATVAITVPPRLASSEPTVQEDEYRDRQPGRASPGHGRARRRARVSRGQQRRLLGRLGGLRRAGHDGVRRRPRGPPPRAPAAQALLQPLVGLPALGAPFAPAHPSGYRRKGIHEKGSSMQQGRLKDVPFFSTMSKSELAAVA